MMTDGMPQALNPGNFVTNLQQNMSKMELAMFVRSPRKQQQPRLFLLACFSIIVLILRIQKLISSEPKNGAYTELFAGLSDTITEDNNGGWGELLLLGCLYGLQRNLLANMNCQSRHLERSRRSERIWWTQSSEASSGNGVRSRSSPTCRLIPLEQRTSVIACGCRRIWGPYSPLPVECLKSIYLPWSRP